MYRQVFFSITFTADFLAHFTFVIKKSVGYDKVDKDIEEDSEIMKYQHIPHSQFFKWHANE